MESPRTPKSVIKKAKSAVCGRIVSDWSPNTQFSTGQRLFLSSLLCAAVSIFSTAFRARLSCFSEVFLGLNSEWFSFVAFAVLIRFGKRCHFFSLAVCLSSCRQISEELWKHTCYTVLFTSGQANSTSIINFYFLQLQKYQMITETNRSN